MEHREAIPPEVAPLQKRLDKTTVAISQATAIGSRLGTEGYVGVEKYILPSTPDSAEGNSEGNTYLQDLIHTTVSSAEVAKGIATETVPALQALYSEVENQIELRKKLLSEAAELTVGLHKLQELERYVSNPDVIPMIKRRLDEIDQALHFTSYTPYSIHKNNTHPDQDSPTQNHPLLHLEEPRGSYRPAETLQHQEPVSPQGLHLVTLITDQENIEAFSAVINQNRIDPRTQEEARERAHGTFTRLFHRVRDGIATETELEVWGKVQKYSPYPDHFGDTRKAFHNEIDRYIDDGPRLPLEDEFTPPDLIADTEQNPLLVSSQDDGNPEPPKRARRERTLFDPFAKVDGRLQHIISRLEADGASLNMRQKYTPTAAMEVFGFASEDDERLQKDGTITLDKAKDHHGIFTFRDGFIVTCLKARNLSRDQKEQILQAIDLRIEEWMEAHPEAISSK